MRAHPLIPATASPTTEVVPTPSAWAAFEADLAATLSTFDKEVLILEAKGTHAFVQLCASASSYRCETVSNAFLPPEAKLDDARLSALIAMGWSPPTVTPGDVKGSGSPNFFRDVRGPGRAEEAAHLLVRTLAEVHGVVGTEHLEYTSFDGEGHDVILPSLGVASRPPRAASPPDASKRRREATSARRAAGIRRRLLAEVRRGTKDDSIVFDDDDALRVSVGDERASLHVLEDPLAIRMVCLVADGVETTPRLLLHVHEVNATLALGRLIYRSGAVFLSLDIPAAPLRIEHVRLALRGLRVIAAAVRPELNEFMPTAHPPAAA